MDQFLKKTIREAGSIAKEYFDAGVTYRTKAHLGDLLTDADLAVSNYLVETIHKKYPDHQIHSEEMKDDINPGAQYEWVIDPIDGTRNFAMGISLWCILVALVQNGETIMGAVYNPNANELFFAKKGKGATMNGLPIHVNNVELLDHGFGICTRGFREKQKEISSMISRVVTETNVWIHSHGTMLSTCYIATGGIDFFVSNTGFDHDYLAPLLICEEAGALVTGIDGKPVQRHQADVVVANPVLHPKVLKLFEEKE